MIGAKAFTADDITQIEATMRECSSGKWNDITVKRLIATLYTVLKAGRELDRCCSCEGGCMCYPGTCTSEWSRLTDSYFKVLEAK